MLIGQLADALEIPTRTIRFYERKGLLPEPQRADNGYRVYDDATLARLRFIRTAQAAGLTLAEIASIIHVRDDGTAPCSHVDSLLETKLAEVRHRRRQLAALESELALLLDRSRQLDPADCTAGEICHIFSPSYHT
ncbi:MAG: heavy metal-responsive transcriptional regulator [Acidimicrobiia bacterium]|nr:heavy metal-responsive transcriptional regulator [Acidimicrobiia bacterium]